MITLNKITCSKKRGCKYHWHVFIQGIFLLPTRTRTCLPQRLSFTPLQKKRRESRIKKCPNSYFMDVKGSDAVKSPRSCVPAAALSCQTTGRKARLMGEAPLGGSSTESSWFKMSGDHPNKQTKKLYVYIHTYVCVKERKKKFSFFIR